MNAFPDSLQREILLDSSQREFAESRVPLTVLSAPPGSGKTQALSARATSLIRQGIPPDEILVLTFTNQAKEAFTDRLLEDCPELRENPNFRVQKSLHESPTDPDRLWICTFHDACMRILRCHPELSQNPGVSLRVISRDTRWDLLHQAAVQTNTLPAGSSPEALEKFLWNLSSNFDALCTAGLDPALPPGQQIQIPLLPRKGADRGKIQKKLSWHSVKNAKIFAAYQEILETLGEIDISDIPRKCRNLLNEDMSVRQAWSKRFQHVLADEYQDTTPLLTEILSVLGRHAEIAVCGDEDQSIFGWTGAAGSFQDLDRLERTHGTPVPMQLIANWRLTEQLRTQAELLRATKIAIPAGEGEIHHRQGPPAVHIVAKSQKALPEILAEKIQERRQETGSEYHHCAVMCRTNREAMALAESLSVLGVPVSFHRGKATSPLSDALAAWLGFAADPDSPHTPSNALRSAPLSIPQTEFTSPRRLAASRQSTLLEELHGSTANPDPKTRKLLQSGLALCGAVLTVVRHCGAQTPFPARTYIDSVYRSSGLQEHGLQQQGPPKTDFESYLDQLKAAASQAQNPKEVFRIASEMQPDPAVQGENQEALLGKVAIRNMHQVKGNEWHHVFCVGWQEGIFPSRDDPAEIEAERRVAYTALTRASRTFTCFSIASGRPSRYVNEAKMEIQRQK